jgi:hypothetical protein
MADQGWSLDPTRVSDPVPVFVVLTLAGARLDVPTFAVQLKPVGLTDSIGAGVATGGAALVMPEPAFAVFPMVVVLTALIRVCAPKSAVLAISVPRNKAARKKYRNPLRL